MGSLNTYFFSNAQETRMRAASALGNLLLEKKQTNVPVLLLCSGGSALTLLWEVTREFLSPQVTVSMLDERYYSDPAILNFSQLMATDFYAESLVAGCSHIDTRPGEGESLAAFAFRFENELKYWRRNNRGGEIIATMGIGNDGHTAGIVPFPENPAAFQELFEKEYHWVAGYDAGEKISYPLRATATAVFLRKEVAHAVAFAVGTEKKNAIRQVLSENGSLPETPARVLWEMRNVLLYTEKMGI